MMAPLHDGRALVPSASRVVNAAFPQASRGVALIDRLVGWISPERGLRRMVARDMLRSEMYAAAKTNRLTGDWHPLNSNINDIIGASSSAVRGRVRQLVRDFPYFARAVKVLVDYTVGEGIVYQSRVKGTDGKLDRKMNSRIEDAFKRWCDEADISGKLHFYEMMRLAKRQDVESGEFVIVKTATRRRNRFLPFALQMFEADWLSGTADLAPGTSRDIDVKQGIEFNRFTGEVLAYHFIDPDGWGKTKRIEARNVLHGFETLRPGQLRGISPLVSGVLVAHSLRDYMAAEMDAAKMAAKYLAIVKRQNPGIAMGGLPTDATTGQKIEELENAIIEYLRPNEDITIASNPRPGSNFPPFVKLILCMFAATAGVPYELVSCNYEDLNFSVARTIRNDFALQLKPVARRHVMQFALPIQKEFLHWSRLTGALDLPGYEVDPYRFYDSEWQPPGMEYLNPLQEAKADADAVAALLRSPQEVARRRGRELEDIYNEIADANEMARQRKIAPASISTAQAGNPAAVANQDTKE